MSLSLFLLLVLVVTLLVAAAFGFPHDLITYAIGVVWGMAIVFYGRWIFVDKDR